MPGDQLKGCTAGIVRRRVQVGSVGNDFPAVGAVRRVLAARGFVEYVLQYPPSFWPAHAPGEMLGVVCALLPWHTEKMHSNIGHA